MDAELLEKFDVLRPKLTLLTEALAKLKEQATEEINKSQGGSNMDLAKELEETKAALAEAKKVKDEEVEKAKAAVKAEFEAEASKKKAADDKAAEDKKAKDDKDADDAKAALVEATAAKKAEDKKAWLDKMKKAMSSEEISELGVEFSDVEKAIASEKSYADLVKLVASLNSELAEVHAAKKKVEDKEKAEARFRSLAEKGLAFIGVKGVAQKEKLEGLNDEAFASYESELSSIAETLNNKEGFSKEAIAAAKASVGILSQGADLGEDMKSKFSQLMA